MNEHIQTFLENYSNEDGWGNFTNTRKLHKVRDILTASDWIDITDAAMSGYFNLPNNLQKSLTSKFSRLAEWQLDNGYGEFVTPEVIETIMCDKQFTKSYGEVQQLVWGVLTSCIEVIHYNQIANEFEDNDNGLWEL